ncbi:Uma2 family endonuclease [Mucilaginibacter sp. OK098]|uniref:Uma2 family endonuclease n=1 Tax=Mucilaginibacter sp. OK098 TaxID=1855297 RepID=UPI00091533AE|nr:Uma2 family endonuclease [Mucilaginibacter sp. OK098]SHN31241.1 Endonuclease, Uma2 family (restriction endonuclease fold) [Mucilaginibacter sp. OK098]
MKNVLDIPRTAMEVFNMLPEGTLCEVIDNVLYMSPSPTTDHQRILLNITFEIKSLINKKPIGEVFVAPCDVYLDSEQSVVEPDIIFISAEKSSMIQRKGIYGAPNLLIEILSTNIQHDKKRKLELYERNGVAEYIIIDPDTKETWHYLLSDGVYKQQTRQQTGSVYIHQLSLTINF